MMLNPNFPGFTATVIDKSKFLGAHKQKTKITREKKGKLVIQSLLHNVSKVVEVVLGLAHVKLPMVTG